MWLRAPQVNRVSFLVVQHPTFLVPPLIGWLVTGPLALDPTFLSLFQVMLLREPAALREVLHQDLLHTLDSLCWIAGDDAQEKSARVAITWWTNLARAVNVFERDLRNQHAMESKNSLECDPTGCSWIKCARYGRECDITMMSACRRCAKAVHCGPLFQSRSAPSIWPRLARYSLCLPAKGLGRRRPQNKMYMKDWIWNSVIIALDCYHASIGDSTHQLILTHDTGCCTKSLWLGRVFDTSGRACLLAKILRHW